MGEHRFALAQMLHRPIDGIGHEVFLAREQRVPLDLAPGGRLGLAALGAVEHGFGGEPQLRRSRETTQSGLDAFADRFRDARTVVAGTGGIPLQRIPVAER